MILSDRDIRARLARGDLVVTPLEDADGQIQPASIDLTLGDEFVVYRGQRPVYGTWHEAKVQVARTRCDRLLLVPGEFVLATTRETVRIPSDLAARVDGRSSIGRLGVVVHVTAGFVDPGFEGQLTLEMACLMPCPVELPAGCRIAQLVLYRLASPSRRPYGPERESKYQNQQGPTESRMAVGAREVATSAGDPEG